MTHAASRWLATLTLMFTTFSGAQADVGSRLWATGGVTSVDGSAGGGLSPWALLGSYASDEEWGGTATLSEARFDDYSLTVLGAGLTWKNRIELTYSQQTLDLDSLVFVLTGLGLQEDELVQDNFGLKVRLAGDVLYSEYGQWSAGLIHKRNRKYAVADAVGSEDDFGTDFYVSGSKLFFAAVGGRNLLLNGTVRATKANQGGLLGFGGDKNDSYEAMFEGSVSVFLNRKWLVGTEYRQKPDNLSFDALGFPGEEDWWDVFAVWLPTRNVSVTAAYVALGDIGPFKDQDGGYLSLQTSF